MGRTDGAVAQDTKDRTAPSNGVQGGEAGYQLYLTDYDNWQRPQQHKSKIPPTIYKGPLRKK